MSDDARISELVGFYDYGESDRALLAELRPLLEKKADTLVAAFYRHLLSFSGTRELLRDPWVTEGLLAKQRSYLLSLAGPSIDAAYVESRRRIGMVHERRGLDPRWYLGAYALYMSLLTPLVGEYLAADPPRWERTVAALNKLLLLDAQLGLEGYALRREENLEFLNRELVRSGRRLAHDYERQGAELRRTTERAREAEHLASIGTLVAGLAHEIGTPMGVIQGHAKLLEGAVSDESAKWRLRTIQAQISRISMIIKSLLNMARPSRSSRVPVALEPLLENTMAFLTEKFQRRSITVDRDFQPVASVNGDPERLQQLFLNLFINAADAMVKGGQLQIGLRPTPEGDVEIVVADSGPGIPEEHLGRIFDPFFTTKAAGEGNGLGLAVVQGIVHDYGGVIEASSSPGRGTEFRITFPHAATDMDSTRSAV